jgi:acrylyl-CoA reductase (NADPH)
MTPDDFSAFYVERDSSGAIRSGIKTISQSNLPPGEVLIRAQWSSLNFKDALAATGHPGVARRLPHVPGIDVAGVVADISADHQTPELAVGDEVLVTGYELGAGQWGGWSEYVRVPKEWVIKRPNSLTLRETMVLGTAGFTAAQCVDALLHHGIQPKHGDVVVTGATGGVGSLAVMLLRKLLFRVCAVTGKAALRDRLEEWGAAEVLGRDVVLDSSSKPLLPGRWAGAVDTVGGATLSTIIRQTKDQGCVTACGLVGGTDMSLSVYPFILRGVTLAGITSSGCPRPDRETIWAKLSSSWRLPDLDRITTEVRLDQVGDLVPKILAGEIVGRTVVRID